MQKRLNFSKEKRLLKKQSFSLVFKKNDKKIYYKNFLILIKKNEYLVPRLGIIIPKKIVKNAVDRNLLKRKIRESFRKNQLDLVRIDIIFLLTKKSKLDRDNIKKLNFFNVWNLINSKTHLNKD